jgi:hypothetical protein
MFLCYTVYLVIVLAWKIKDQLDATEGSLLQNLLSAQHVSGTILPIIRSSRVIHVVAACGIWRFGLQVYQRHVNQGAMYHRQQPPV